MEIPRQDIRGHAISFEATPFPPFLSHSVPSLIYQNASRISPKRALQDCETPLRCLQTSAFSSITSPSLPTRSEMLRLLLLNSLPTAVAQSTYKSTKEILPLPKLNRSKLKPYGQQVSFPTPKTLRVLRRRPLQLSFPDAHSSFHTFPFANVQVLQPSQHTRDPIPLHSIPNPNMGLRASATRASTRF